MKTIQILWKMCLQYLKHVTKYCTMLMKCVTKLFFLNNLFKCQSGFKDLDYRPSMNLWYFYSFSTALSSLLIKRVWTKNGIFYSSCCALKVALNTVNLPLLELFRLYVLWVVLSDKEVCLSGIEPLYNWKYSLKFTFHKKNL